MLLEACDKIMENFEREKENLNFQVKRRDVRALIKAGVHMNLSEILGS